MRVAVLDDAGVLTGFETVSKPTKGQVEVPEECDLEPGKYRWDGSAFWPIRIERARRQAVQGDELLRALVLAVDSMMREKPVPASAVDAINRFKSTYDAKEPD